MHEGDLKLASGSIARRWGLSQSTVKIIIYFSSLIIFITFSMIFYCNYEGWTPEVAFSFAIVTLSTVGYGYHHPTDDNSRLFTIFFMLFGVYFVFSGLNEIIALHVHYVAYKSSKEPGTVGEKYLATRRRFAGNVALIVVTLFIGALGLMACEGWSFISSLYFAVETTATIGYGDLSQPQAHTRIFLGAYILLSCGVVTYAFSNLHIMKAGLKLLDEDEQRTLKRQSLEFIVRMDTGNGVSRADFILAILEQQGIINAEKDIEPWSEKFDLLDTRRTGRVYKRELEVFHRQEAVLASSHLEEIDRDRSASITPANMPLLNAAERVLRSPWTSMDGGRPEKRSHSGQSGSQQLSSSPAGLHLSSDALTPMLAEGHY